MLKRIPVGYLRVGMFVEEYGDGTLESPYAYPKKVVQSQDEITEIQSDAHAVTIDTEKGLAPIAKDAVLDSAVSMTKSEVLGPGIFSSFAEEIFISRKVYNTALDHMAKLLGNIRAGKSFDVEDSDPITADIAESTARNYKASASLSVIRSHGYVSNHGVNVAFLAAAFGRFLGLPDENVRTLATAGFFHDIGKALTSERILNKPGKLTAEEYETIKRHPLDGMRLLRENGEMNPDVLGGVLDHHERHDGSGYPQGKEFVEINPYARLICIADVYDALISYRTYRPAMTPNQALQCMYKEKGTLFFEDDLDTFIKFIGIYPIGSFVRLENGKYAVVADIHADLPLQPKIKIVYDSKLRSVRPETVDLSSLENLDGMKIESCLNAKDLKINVEHFLP